MLSNKVNIKTLMTMSLKTGDVFRPSFAAILSTKNTLSLINNNNSTVREFIPLIRRVELNPFSAQLGSIESRNAVIINVPKLARLRLSNKAKTNK